MAALIVVGITAVFGPDGSWVRPIVGLATAAIPIVLGLMILSLWEFVWAPVNHARALSVAKSLQSDWEVRARQQFEHHFKYGNLLKDILGMKPVQDQGPQLNEWRQLALKWKQLLDGTAKDYLTNFEAQRLGSKAGLTLQAIPDAPQKINEFHRDLDGRLQRLESVIEREAWKQRAAADTTLTPTASPELTPSTEASPQQEEP